MPVYVWLSLAFVLLFSTFNFTDFYAFYSPVSNHISGHILFIFCDYSLEYLLMYLVIRSFGMPAYVQVSSAFFCDFLLFLRCSCFLLRNVKLYLRQIFFLWYFLVINPSKFLWYKSRYKVFRPVSLS